MRGSIRGVAAGLALCVGALGLGVLAPGAALAQTTGTRTSSFAYDATSGLLTQEVIEPDTPALRLQTDYTYNAFGHKVAVTVSGADIATRSASTTYDTKGQFPKSASNALSHAESWEYDARFGTPTKHTGPNGLVTTWEYDGFGRKTKEVRADGTRSTWNYLYCSGTAGGTASCPSGAAHLVQVKALGPDGTTKIAPTATQYLDKLDRVIAADTEGFDGSPIRTETRYDALGRVEKKSRPYFVTGGSPKWITYTYDTLGRVLTETQPNSGVTSQAYHGLTTSVTNAASQTSTTIKYSQGQVVQVKDAQNSTTSYQYEPFRQSRQGDRRRRQCHHLCLRHPRAQGHGQRPRHGDLNLHLRRPRQAQDPDQRRGRGHQLELRPPGPHHPARRAGAHLNLDLGHLWPQGDRQARSGQHQCRLHTRPHYDALGRPDQVQITVNAATHTIATAYDAASRVDKVTYPSGFAVTYGYNATGYQHKLSNAVTSEVYWTANTRDAELHLTQQTAGNGVVTTQVFDPNTGQLTQTTAGTAAAVQNHTYTYDLLGKLLTRADANTSLSESFAYDALNRLVTSTVSLTPTPLVSTFAYNAIGNLTFKSDVGTYSYPAPGQPRPHGVSSISGGVINTTFTYDAKGNMTSGNGLSVTYTAFNKPATITRGTASVSFDHDPEQQRYAQTSLSGVTLYIAGGGVLAERFAGTGGIVRWTNYLMVGGRYIGIHVENSDETTATRYFHTDHLGSIAVITNEAGAVVERLSYDAWGLRRHPDGTPDPSGSISSQSSRGFTGHEHLAEVGLIHMNGRVYDPLLARFGTPDPMTEDPFSTQGWNRYAYVGNSPVNFTDPSGYCFLGCFWKPIFKAIGNFFKENWGAILQIAAAFVCQPVGLGPVCAAATATFVTGVTSGNLGLALRAGVTAFFTAAAMEGIGNITGHTPDFLSSAHLQNIAGHALVGCLSAVMGGAKCGPGALAGAVGSFAVPILRDIFPHPKTNPSHLFGGTVASAIIGGLASVAGGGKFANGAVTAAFGYLFNHALGDYSPPTRSPQFPNSQIPDGPWEWQPDADNGRGGVWRNPEGYTASYDEKLSHWDINPPQDQEGDLLRRRYSNRGVLLDDDEAHRYRGPRLPPIKPRIGPPIILPVSPCVGMPQLCLGPGGT